MRRNLSGNIRELRRAHSLTQQQLADALGVTVGAVYKWEAGLSAPDLDLLIGLADLFETSVDVLLGYAMKNNKQDAVVARLKDCLHRKDRSGLDEAEKALLRYPNCFDIVYQSAQLYYLLGLTEQQQELLRRSIPLLERSILLLGQNTDPEISELSITVDMANVYMELGEEETALELMKKNNPRGILNDVIGQALACFCNRPDEAEEYLSRALISVSAMLIRIVNGYVNLYFKRDQYESGALALKLALDYFVGLKVEGKSSLFDKPCVDFYVCLAYAQMKMGKRGEARASLLSAKKLAEAFDKNPDYSGNSVRFVSTVRQQTAFDSLGETASEAAAKAMSNLKDEAFRKLWEEIENET